MKFYSKKDLFGHTLILGPALIITFLTILVGFQIIPDSKILSLEPLIIGCAFFWGWFIIIYNFTYYTIDQEYLIARMGYFRKTKVKLSEITQIKKDQFGLFTVGLSKDIVNIKYGNNKFLNISPKNREIVITEILKINPKIQLLN